MILIKLKAPLFIIIKSLLPQLIFIYSFKSLGYYTINKHYWKRKKKFYEIMYIFIFYLKKDAILLEKKRKEIILEIFQMFIYVK